MSADIALRNLAPFLLLLPGMGLVIWFGVGAGLRPLRLVATQIQQRRPEALVELKEWCDTQGWYGKETLISRMMTRPSDRFELPMLQDRVHHGEHGEHGEGTEKDDFFATDEPR